jgi:hypothetical protein
MLIDVSMVLDGNVILLKPVIQCFLDILLTCTMLSKTLRNNTLPRIVSWRQEEEINYFGWH